MLWNIKSAERAGFEPAIPLRVYKLSRLALSTTQTPLRTWVAKIYFYLIKTIICISYLELKGRSFDFIGNSLFCLRFDYIYK